MTHSQILDQTNDQLIDQYRLAIINKAEAEQNAYFRDTAGVLHIRDAKHLDKFIYASKVVEDLRMKMFPNR